MCVLSLCLGRILQELRTNDNKIVENGRPCRRENGCDLQVCSEFAGGWVAVNRGATSVRIDEVRLPVRLKQKPTRRPCFRTSRPTSLDIAPFIRRSVADCILIDVPSRMYIAFWDSATRRHVGGQRGLYSVISHCAALSPCIWPQDDMAVSISA